ncbi:MAG: hypothetical protein ACXWMN_04910 [Candidatus Limnocylindria bacterium]
MFLRVESAALPCHFGGLAVLDGGALVDPSGRLRLGEIVDRLSRRLATVPQLRRRVLFPGPLRGRPLWVDDAGRFRVARRRPGSQRARRLARRCRA